MEKNENSALYSRGIMNEVVQRPARQVLQKHEGSCSGRTHAHHEYDSRVVQLL